jgi:hypothetical protein
MHRKPHGLKTKTPPGKKVIADKGHPGEPQISTRNPFDPPEVTQIKKRAKARLETFNGRLKVFKKLEHRFRHGVKKHRAVFEAVCILLQCESENGHPLFEVQSGNWNVTSKTTVSEQH